MIEQAVNAQRASHKGIVSRCRRRLRTATLWAVAAAALVLAGPAMAQGNLDAGKTAAQIFSDTCAGCHRSPGQVRRASASFLRSHYTTGSEEASSMARYLANVPAETRPPASQKKNASPKETPTEARRGEPKEQPKDQPKGSRRAAAEPKPSAAAAQAPAEAKPPEPVIETPPPAPALEPFEE